MLIAAAGALLLPFASLAGPLQATLIVLSGICIAIGTVFVLPTSRSLASSLVASNQQGATLGSLASLTGIASVIGPVAAGWIYDQSAAGCFIFQASACLIGAIILGNKKNDTTQSNYR